MTKIRLQLPSQDKTLTVNYKSYIKYFIYNTLHEFKTQLSSYHSIKEIECRKIFLNFIKQKISDFELLFILDYGVEFLNEPSCKILHHDYENIANMLAFVFENLKNTIAPKWNVQKCLEGLYSIYNNNEVKLKTNFYIEKFIKIYLQKENLSYFKNVDINNGLVLLDNKYKVALCGDLSNPKFKLLNDEIIINDFAFDKLTRYLQLYNKLLICYKLYEKLKNLKRLIDIRLEGNYKNFTIFLEGYKFTVNENIEICLEKILTFFCDLSFDFDFGWICEFENFEITVKKYKINQIIENIKNHNLFDFENESNLKYTYIDSAYKIYQSLKKYKDGKINFIFQNLTFFKIFKDIVNLEKNIYIPLKHIKGVNRNFKNLYVKDCRFFIIKLTENNVSFMFYIKNIQIFINEKFELSLKKTKCLLEIKDFLNLLQNVPNTNIILLIKPENKLIMKSGYLELQMKEYKIFLYNHYCKINQYKIKNSILFISFFEYIYLNAVKILKQYLIVEIEGFIIEYDIANNFVIFKFLNKIIKIYDEIIHFKNICNTLKNLNFFYTHDLIPDLIENHYVCFKFNNYICKLKYIDFENISDDDNVFRKMSKTLIKDGNIKCLDNLEIQEFINIYNKHKK